MAKYVLKFDDMEQMRIFVATHNTKFVGNMCVGVDSLNDANYDNGVRQCVCHQCYVNEER